MFLLFDSYWIRTVLWDHCRHCCPQLILERNHVVFLAFLFSCQRTDLAKGRLDCQTPPSVSSGMFSVTWTHFVWPGHRYHKVLRGLKRSNCLRTSGTVEFTSRPATVSTIAPGTITTLDRPPLFQTTFWLFKDPRRLPPGPALTPKGVCLFRASPAQLVVQLVVTVQFSENYFPR